MCIRDRIRRDIATAVHWTDHLSIQHSHGDCEEGHHILVLNRFSEAEQADWGYSLTIRIYLRDNQGPFKAKVFSTLDLQERILADSATRSNKKVHGILSARWKSLPVPGHVLWTEECAQHLPTDDAECTNGLLVGAVSYTHLDVYKRQVVYISFLITVNWL